MNIVTTLLNIGARALRLTRPLPDGVRDAGKNGFIYAAEFTGMNYAEFAWRDSTFRFEFFDMPTLREFAGCIEDGIVAHEEVDIGYLDVDESYDAIVDIGAHFGIYSVILGVVNPGLPLYAFEPNEGNRTVLKRQLAANDLLADRVRVRSEVVSGESGTITFYENPAGRYNVSHTANPSEHHADHVPVEKEAIAICDVCREADISKPWVKIDAEGAEYEILENILTCNHVDSVGGLLEIHLNRADITVKRFEKLLDKHGYAWTQVKESPPTNPGYAFFKA